MLTRQERQEIAEKAKLYKGKELDWDNITDVLTGSLCWKSDDELLDRIIDLCDTSNMVELPVDKDGIPFKKGNTVYESDGTEHKVDGYTFTRCDTKILSVVDPINNSYVVLEADELTHKKPITIASLVGEIRRTLSQNTIMNKEATSKLWEITDQIEMLGDGND